MVLVLPPWEDAPPQMTLNEAEVHLWRFRLDLSSGTLARLQGLLSRDERDRAERLVDPVKTGRFFAARGQLRQVLSRYQGCAPEDLRFEYGTHGKPQLAGAAGKAVQFNLSHAAAWGVLAVTRDCAVGVDIEKVNRRLDYEQIAARFFSGQEVAVLAHSNEVRRRRVFCRLWTRKEARAKAQGGGLFSLAAANAAPACPCRWFVAAGGYLGAFTVMGRVTSVRRWTWREQDPCSPA